MAGRIGRNGFALGLVVGTCLTLVAIIWLPGLASLSWVEHDGVLVTSKDTLAQWVMAIIGLVATGISAWAVVLLKQTLMQTSIATTAAQDATAVTRDIGQRQVRAYLIDLNVRVTNYRPGALPTYYVTMKNTGQSPARSVRVAFGSRHGLGDADQIRFTGLVLKKMVDVPAGESGPQQFTVSIPIDPLIHAQVLSGGTKIAVGGLSIYKDVFGKTCRTVFKYYLDPTRPTPNNGFTMSVCEKNNRQT